MKVVITGHVSGIGQALFCYYRDRGHEVLGFDKSTGSDIDKLEIRKKIVEQSLDADIFINNAFAPLGQTELLEQMIQAWDGSQKKIINLNSKMIFLPLKKIPIFDQYIKQKQQQNQIIIDRMTVSSPQILNVILGLVDTALAKMFTGKKLTADRVANLIYDLSMLDDVYIQEIVIEVPGTDWKDIVVGSAAS